MHEWLKSALVFAFVASVIVYLMYLAMIAAASSPIY